MSTWFAVAVVACLVSAVLSFPPYQNKIPNGANIVNPVSKAAHSSLGHWELTAGGVRSCFGLDYASVGGVWKDLCPMDSDGDGMTNGQELGDPLCKWAPGNGHVLSKNLGHPGWYGNGDCSSLAAGSSEYQRCKKNNIDHLC